jgi:hypothetical protein
MGETALQMARLAAVEPYGDPRQVREEPPVMADNDERCLARRKFGFEPFDRGQIKVVRRLVKQQNIGRRREYAGKRGTARLAAGQHRRVPVAAEAEPFQEIVGGVAVVGRADLKTKPFDYLAGLLDAPDTEKPLNVQCASVLLPYTNSKLREQAPRRVINALVIEPPQSASECAAIISMILAAAAAGRLDLNDAQDLVKMAESYVRAFSSAEFEAIAARVSAEVRRELTDVGVERRAEYCVPETPTAQ